MADSSAMEILARLLPSMALIVGALLLLRRWGGRGKSPDTALRIVGRTGVTRNAVVAIVQVDGQRYLVGAGDHGVNLLAQLEAETKTEPEEKTVALENHRTYTDEGRLRPVRQITGPWSGLVHRLQVMTVRTHVEASLREEHR